jgi:hypothetical protein
MTIDELNALKTPIFKINPDLDKYVGIPMFVEKIERANEVLRTVGLPNQATIEKVRKSAGEKSK